jgi:hypothetical protein
MVINLLNNFKIKCLKSNWHQEIILLLIFRNINRKLSIKNKELLITSIKKYLKYNKKIKL